MEIILLSSRVYKILRSSFTLFAKVREVARARKGLLIPLWSVMGRKLSAMLRYFASYSCRWLRVWLNNWAALKCHGSVVPFYNESESALRVVIINPRRSEENNDVEWCQILCWNRITIMARRYRLLWYTRSHYRVAALVVGVQYEQAERWKCASLRDEVSCGNYV